VGPVWPDRSSERRAAAAGYRAIAGIDEAGRGALAGPVVAAAVILEKGWRSEGLRDSKTLSPGARERLFARIAAEARAWGVGIAECAEIDAVNVLEATRRAMHRAVRSLPFPPDYLLIDAVALPRVGLPFESPTKADRDLISVAAASIMAKVTRDRMMGELDARFRGYGFSAHKGYGTKEHLEALSRLGPCAIHRRTFRPVAFFGGGPNLEVLSPAALRARTTRTAPDRSGKERAGTNGDP